MIGTVLAFIIGALLGLSWYLLFGPGFSAANRNLNADIDFMRSLPASDDRGQK